MVRREDVKVKPGFEYDHYFPRAKLITIKKKQGATVADTLLLIPAVVRETLFHTKRFADEVIRADTIEESCRRLWNFVYTYMAYKKDEDGKEQVRSPARAWHDRHNFDPITREPMGIDCDCMSLFVVSVLYNLKIDNIFFRITKYPDEDKSSSEISFSHIYPIVILPDGRQITIDCVVNSFNYEEPYLQKKDTKMDLEYLNGVSDTRNYKTGDSQDFMGLMGEQEALSELGKLFKNKSSGGSSEGGSEGKKKGKVKEFLKKGLHVTNIANPATATLRAGILAAMKLNFMKIGGQLRYAYLTEDQAKEKGLIMDRYYKMKKIREKLEKIYYGAGGKIESLKKSILTGRGNKNKEVPMNGLGYISYDNVDGLHEDMQLSRLIGRDLYTAESMEGIEGLGSLGEPVTAATIAAATTVLTTIAALIKSVGSMVPKKKASENTGGGESGGGGDNAEGGGDNSSSGGDSDNSNSSENSGGGFDEGTNGSEKKNLPATTNKTPAKNDSGDGSNEDGDSGSNDQKSMAKTKNDPPEAKPSFWENNKKWIKPVGITVGSLGLLALIYNVLKPKVQNAKPKFNPAMNGIPKKKKKPAVKKNPLNGLKTKAKKGGTHQTKKNKSNEKKKVVTLL